MQAYSKRPGQDQKIIDVVRSVGGEHMRHIMEVTFVDQDFCNHAIPFVRSTLRPFTVSGIIMLYSHAMDKASCCMLSLIVGLPSGQTQYAIIGGRDEGYIIRPGCNDSIGRNASKRNKTVCQSSSIDIRLVFQHATIK